MPELQSYAPMRLWRGSHLAARNQMGNIAKNSLIQRSWSLRCVGFVVF
jgi:hypothetical protein